VRDFGTMTGEVNRPVSEFERDPVLAAICTASDEPIDWIHAGQALERVHLTATHGALRCRTWDSHSRSVIVGGQPGRLRGSPVFRT
jgi:hypothetical protein